MTFYDTGPVRTEQRNGFARDAIGRLKFDLLRWGLTAADRAWGAVTRSGGYPQQAPPGASNGPNLMLPRGVWGNAPVYSRDEEPSASELDLAKHGSFSSGRALTLPFQAVPRPAYYYRKYSDGKRGLSQIAEHRTRRFVLRSKNKEVNHKHYLEAHTHTARLSKPPNLISFLITGIEMSKYALNGFRQLIHPGALPILSISRLSPPEGTVNTGKNDMGNLEQPPSWEDRLNSEIQIIIVSEVTTFAATIAV